MSKNASKAFLTFKYGYLTAFFALLAGLFYPFITNRSEDIPDLSGVVSGVIVLFVGLAGAILLYKAGTSQSKNIFLLAGGFLLVGISLYYVYVFTGRI